MFSNQLPNLLADELRLASQSNIRPVECHLSDPEFCKVVEAGTIKWVVTQTGKLLVVPKFEGGREIAHAVLSAGQPVLAAGEAEIAGGNGKYYWQGIFLSIQIHFSTPRWLCACK